VPGHEVQPALAGVGTLTTNHTPQNGDIWYRFQIEMPVLTETGTSWTYHLDLYGIIAQNETVIYILDGDYHMPGEEWIDNMLCTDQCWSLESYRFDSCTFVGALFLDLFSIDFGSGQLDLHLEMGTSMASTEPAAFVRAEGTFSGVPFDQQDYYHLIYNPEHHHFARDYAILFDAPIAGACGLKALGLVPWEPYDITGLFSIDCDLSDIGELNVTSVEHQVVPHR